MNHDHLHPVFRGIVERWFAFNPTSQEFDLPVCTETGCEERATHFTEKDAPYDAVCDKHFEAAFTQCPHCEETVPKSDLQQVCVARQTHWSPAEYDEVCTACLIKGRGPHRRLSRHERLQAAADAGFDTWAEYRGER